ncbi:hypothetical protein ACKWTF_009031 [Chironomus riparius]
MEKAHWKTDDLSSTKITQKVDGNDITLDLTVTDFCMFCNRPKSAKSYCCGYPSSRKAVEINISQTSSKNESNLKSDMKRMLFNQMLSDFTFIVENEKIPVSKIILAARSPVFEKMFYSDFKEKNLNQQIVNSQNLKAASFKELIRYIYTDEVHNLSEHVFDLLYASDYYQIEGLKAICEEGMLKILCAKNAQKIFQSAHSYQCSMDIKAAAFSVIKNIFQKMTLSVPDQFVNNPSKVTTLFQKKDSLEKELVPPRE